MARKVNTVKLDPAWMLRVLADLTDLQQRVIEDSPRNSIIERVRENLMRLGARKPRWYGVPACYGCTSVLLREMERRLVYLPITRVRDPNT